VWLKLQEFAVELIARFKRLIALDVHQAKITACAIDRHDDGRQEMTQRDFGAFKRDPRALAQWRCRSDPGWWSRPVRGCTGRARSRRWNALKP
jgi:hypothetical protein